MCVARVAVLLVLNTFAHVSGECVDGSELECQAESQSEDLSILLQGRTFTSVKQSDPQTYVEAGKGQPRDAWAPAPGRIDDAYVEAGKGQPRDAWAPAPGRIDDAYVKNQIQLMDIDLYKKIDSYGLNWSRALPEIATMQLQGRLQRKKLFKQLIENGFAWELQHTDLVEVDVQAPTCTCNSKGKQSSTYGDWCWFTEDRSSTTCKLLTGHVVSRSWGRCKRLGVAQVGCDVQVPTCTCNSKGKQSSSHGDWCWFTEDNSATTCKLLTGHVVSRSWGRCKQKGVAQVGCDAKQHGWPTGSSFEAVPGKGWCVDSLGWEGVAKSFTRSADHARAQCAEDATCPAYAGPSSYGVYVWYTDKSPETAGRSAVAFRVERGKSGQGAWQSATCLRKKNAIALKDSDTVLSPPFIGAYTVTQAPLQCRPSHCANNGNGYAVDWMMPKYTPIIAARGGMVIQVVDSHGDGGTCWDANGKFTLRHHANLVCIRHDDGTVANYLHLQKGTTTVKTGDWVKRGTKLGGSGHSGCSTGAHLHFHVRNRKSQLTVPVHFSWPCQNKVGVVPGSSEFQCNTPKCDCTSSCWKSFLAGKEKPWFTKHWKAYCSSARANSIWVMDAGCTFVKYGSSYAEAQLTQECKQNGRTCATYDKGGSHCR